MAFHEDELKNYHNVILMGQQKLEGKTLQKAYREKTGRTPSLQALAGKSVIEEVKESHYGFAVVLSMQAKERLDRKIRSGCVCAEVRMFANDCQRCGKLRRR